MRKFAVHLTPAARDVCRDQEAVRRAAQSALSTLDAPGDVQFLKFTSEGKQFALSARLVIDVDFFPNRVPDRVIRRKVRV